MTSRRLEFWLAIGAVVAASGAAISWHGRVSCVVVALVFLSVLIVMRFQAIAGERQRRGNDAFKRAEEIRAQRRRRNG